MKITSLIAGFALVVPTFALGQSSADLAKGSANTSEVLNYGMGYDLQRYSPLKQITAANVRKLAPVWHYSLDDNRAEESQPIVHKGVLYITTHAATAAIDVKTGKQLWKTKVEYPADVRRSCAAASSTAAPRSMTASSSAPRWTRTSSRST